MTSGAFVDLGGLLEAGPAAETQCLGGSLLTPASLASIALAAHIWTQQSTQSPSSIQKKVDQAKADCLTRSVELLGTSAVFVEKNKRSAPIARLDSVPPPEIEWRKGARTSVARSAMLAVILLKPQGTVADVRLVSGFVFNPPWPEFQAAYLDYLRRWQYEMPESSPPVCIEVAINVDFS